MINIRGNSPQEAYLEYIELKNKLNGELGRPGTNGDEEPKIHLPDLGKQCEECGGRMLMRTAKNGSRAGSRFWGCENWKNNGCMHTEAVA